jgi:hypothetical protein
MKKNNKSDKFGTLKGYLLGTLLAMGCLAVLTPAANAGTILNLSNGNGTGPFATVTLTQVDSNTVGVDVTAFAAYKFVDTGSHDTFGFNLTLQSGASGVTLTNFSSGFAADNGFSNGFTGAFAYSVACTGCGSGGSAPLAGPIDFNVNVTNGSLSVADFATKFAADVIGPNATGATFTGLVTNNGTQPSPTVPEPLSLSLVGGGLLALGLLRKRLPR